MNNYMKSALLEKPPVAVAGFGVGVIIGVEIGGSPSSKRI
jgi:hypothetical protein